MTVDMSMLEKIEKLLAKAEATEYEAEREAFMGKAQELMTRHAIDEAMLRVATGDSTVIESIKINVEGNTFMKARAQMAHGLADVNNCYSVAWKYNDHRRGYQWIEFFGTADSLKLCEILWHSLNAQLTKAVANEPIPSHIQGKTFRNNFVLGFADAVVKRLREAKKETLRTETTSSVALVLVNQREQAKEQAMNDHVGQIKSEVMKYRGNSEGWGAGKVAGNNASLSRGEIN